MKYASIIRGINVSGKNKVIMKDLKTHLEKAGFTNVQTYIQSGNIVFESEETELNKVSDDIQTLLKTKHKVDAPVLTLSSEYLIKTVASNPFEKNDNPHQYITFLKEEVLNPEIPDLDFGDDQYAFGDKSVYIFCPNGAARTKLSNNFFENKLKVAATTRNIRTCKKLVDMLS